MPGKFANFGSAILSVQLITTEFQQTINVMEKLYSIDYKIVLMDELCKV